MGRHRPRAPLALDIPVSLEEPVEPNTLGALEILAAGQDILAVSQEPVDPNKPGVQLLVRAHQRRTKPLSLRDIRRLDMKFIWPTSRRF